MPHKQQPTLENGNLDKLSFSLRTTPEDTGLAVKPDGQEPRTEREHIAMQDDRRSPDGPSISLRGAREDSNPPSKTVGQELRAERERRGIQINEVWLALKIRPNYLAAIEESRFEYLPGRAFTIGYVGRYARYLRLDVKNLVERAESEIASRDEAINRSVEIVPLPHRAFRLSATLVIAALLLAALTYYRDDVVPFATQAYEHARAATFAQIASPSPEVTPMQQVVASVAPPSLSPPTGIAIVQPAPPPAELAVSLPAEPPPSTETALPTGTQYGLRNRVSRITLRVHRPTHVQVLGARNRDFLDRTLEPGDTYRVPNVGGLSLTVGDGGAVEVILDGDSKGFVGAQGVQARGLSLQPQAIINRQRRR
jgi:cytoskeleton protein RodZ